MLQLYKPTNGRNYYIDHFEKIIVINKERNIKLLFNKINKVYQYFTIHKHHINELDNTDIHKLCFMELTYIEDLIKSYTKGIKKEKTVTQRIEKKEKIRIIIGENQNFIDSNFKEIIKSTNSNEFIPIVDFVEKFGTNEVRFPHK